MAKWPHLNRNKDKCTRVSVPSKKCAGTHNLLIYFNPSCLSLSPLNVICGITTLPSSILSTHPMVDCSHVGLTQALSFESGTRRPTRWQVSNILALSLQHSPGDRLIVLRHRLRSTIGFVYTLLSEAVHWLRLHAHHFDWLSNLRLVSR